MGGPADAQVPAAVRSELAGRLRSRRPEIEEAILTRLYAVAGPDAGQDAEYLQGLRRAVTAAVGFGLAGIEFGEERSGPVPPEVVAQARNAARNRIGLAVVLRRYAAGYSALGDFLGQEVRCADLGDSAALYVLQRELTALFDRLVETASAEYQDESERAAPLPARRLADRVRRLLVGELVNTAEFDYDFDGWHLGLLVCGPDAGWVPRELARATGRSLLLVEAGPDTFWAWLGGARPPEAEPLGGPTAVRWPAAIAVAVGEPAQGLCGWRLTHRQASAARAVALRDPRPLTRYADVALLATVLADEDLVAFLTRTYLAPLAGERDDGEALRRTLRVFFAAGRNVSSAAASLGVARQTVTRRLQAVEERLGCRLDRRGVEIEAALRVASPSADPWTPAG